MVSDHQYGIEVKGQGQINLKYVLRKIHFDVLLSTMIAYGV